MTQHITSVTIYPTGTLAEPILFESLSDAREFSRISGRLIWAGLAGSSDHMYSFRIYPGGRTEQWPKKRRKRLAPDGTQKRA